MIASSAFYKISHEMWTTLQQLVQRGLHICNEIVWFHNVCFLRNYILIREMCVWNQSVVGNQTGTYCMFILFVQIHTVQSELIDVECEMEKSIRSRTSDGRGWRRHTLHLQERSKLQLPTVGVSTCWNSSKQYTHKKSVGQPSLATRWCCRYSTVGSSPKGTATMA